MLLMQLDRATASPHTSFTAHSATPALLPGRPRQSALTALERSVVALALFDHPTSIDPPSRTARFLFSLFGFRPVNQLADNRLEALRRFCIRLRAAGDAMPTAEIAKLRGAGYSRAALDEARRLIERSGRG
ncbi:hypothetical protein [Sphingomonas crocodyli]|uniref:Uncharacterized protein n=1 Tax=Sphingomonas crocodyli TaxID=1979270 RepID=A0A437LZS1_9SPHN|nr:hypothetical protein [Sphingomonas crocodyli]RVT90931.1 hypothetical protein EOD43_15445 [Sphingomonas crocodyli]